MSIPASQLDPMIRVENVGAFYWRRARSLRREPFWALKDVSLAVRPGESLGVIGRNGAGKTTLLQLIAGIMRPDRGRIENSGFSASMLQLQLGFIPHLTGRENARLSGILLGLTRREVDDRMDEIVDFAELSGFIDEPVSAYSTGMRARLGFSVAFQIDPDILLIDETLSVGDAEFREKSEARIRAKIRSNKTVILATHSARAIAELCDRALWIEDGVGRAAGPAREVLKEYESFWRARAAHSIPPA